MSEDRRMMRRRIGGMERDRRREENIKRTADKLIAYTREKHI